MLKEPISWENRQVVGLRAEVLQVGDELSGQDHSKVLVSEGQLEKWMVWRMVVLDVEQNDEEVQQQFQLTPQELGIKGI